MKGIRIAHTITLLLCACPVANVRGATYSPFQDTTPDVILAGQSPAHQRFGGFVASGSDVNGDGYDDFAVTDNRFNDCRGRAYLYFGGKSRDYERADHVFDGEAAGDMFGAYITLADLNHDKYADVIVGAPGNKNWQGCVYVFFGGSDMNEYVDMVFDGEPGTLGWFGRVIDSADIDRDGYTDLVIDALAFNEDRGRAYFYYGGRPMDSVADKIFDGENPGDLFGREMDMGADVNGDGCGDIIFGCRAWKAGRRQGRPQGRAYLHYGGPKETMDTKCDKVFTGRSPGDQFGSSVCLFDIDNDNHADVMIGARGYRRGQGRMYLYWGETDIDVQPDLIFNGESGSAFGGDNIDCGYLNDDAYGDILVGAYNGGPERKGRIYLYYGAKKDLLDLICDHTFTGEGGMFGWNTALGDINGDHLADLVISAPFYPQRPDSNRIGRAYVYYTKPFPSASEQLQPQFIQEVSEDVKLIGSLHKAAAEGDIDQVKSLISKGINIDSLDNADDPATPLHQAVIAGHRDVVEVLLSHGARIDALDNRAFTPLHRAAECGHTDIAMLLINKGADINRRDSLSASALHHASMKCHREVAALLIAKNANVNAKDAYGDTPLHCAAEAGHKDIVELLIAKGADVNAENDDGQTPINLAVIQNRKDIVELLVEKEAEISIHAAAYLGDIDKVKSFIETGTSVNGEPGRGYRTPLYWAVRNNHKDVAKLLIEKGADVSSISLLYYVCMHGHRDLAEFLIQKGADVNSKDWGDTPSHYAVWGGHVDVLELLLAHGADASAKDSAAWSLLHYAAGSGSTDMTRLLLNKGADVNAKENEGGQTPLHRAAEEGHTTAAELLIANGADVNAKDNQGRTPLSLAKEKGHKEIVELLRKHGAKE